MRPRTVPTVSRVQPGSRSRLTRSKAALSATLAMTGAFVFSRRAEALCPNCLSQANELSPEMRLVGVFLLVPFVVFYVALRVVRRASAPLPRAPKAP